MSSYMLTIGIACGLVALLAASTLVCLVREEEIRHLPPWLLPGLSLVAGSGMILYGGSLLGSLYIEMTRLVSVFAAR